MAAKIFIDPGAAQRFMSFPLGVERNGMDLTLASALVGIDEDPWDLAHALAALPRHEAAARLGALLERVGERIPEIAERARRAVALLPLPRIEGGDLRLALRLALRAPELLLTAALCLVPSGVAMLSLLAAAEKSVALVVASGVTVATAGAIAVLRGSPMAGLLMVASSLLMSLPFLLAGFAT